MPARAWGFKSPLGHAYGPSSVLLARLRGVASSDLWDEAVAATYDEDHADMFTADAVDPAVSLLAELARGGAALAFAVGTGRLAIPLARSGVSVTGIDLSPDMVARLHSKVRPEEVPAVVGDMATTRVPGDFDLVFLPFNSISNLRTQGEQVQCFRNAARHLTDGGHFVIELFVPPLRRLTPGDDAVLFDATEAHVGFDTIDVVTQELSSHHLTLGADGSYRYGVGHFRYIWPAECDLMAALAGLDLVARYGDWDGSPFNANSTKHVSVWRKPASVPD